MYIPETYSVAVIFCFIAMFCWGSWANTQKLAASSWRFELFYWDYTIGILLFSLLLAFTLGSNGTGGQDSITNIAQADGANIGAAILGGAVFNLSNILLVAAIAIAGMSTAITICVGIALVLGVFINYMASPVGDAMYLFSGVLLIFLATILSALAYRKVNKTQQTAATGIFLAIVSGLIMSFFYRFVARSMADDLSGPEIGKLTPYAALFFFASGVFLSNFVLNTIIMKKPIAGPPVTFGDYFRGNLKTHLIGVLGGVIWCMGMSASILASGRAGFAISYGLGQGATIVAVLWGIFVWKEFKKAPPGTNKLLALMILFYLIGLVVIIISRIV